MKKFLVICISAESGMCPFITHVKEPSQIGLKVMKYVSINLNGEHSVWAEAYLFLDDSSMAFYRAFNFDGEAIKVCRDYRPSNGGLVCADESDSF